MSAVRLSPGAITDIRLILHRSKDEFGVDAGARYKALLDQALKDLGEDPSRVGVKPIPDVRPGYFVYHVKFSKPRMIGPSVGRPRHLVVFSVGLDEGVVVAAVVHEREMLERHLDK